MRERKTMCTFCTRHGDGKTWYLQAANYAADLDSDLARRAYVIDFVRDFDRSAANGIAWLQRLRTLPGPLRRPVNGLISRRMERVHFGQPIPIEDCGKVFDLATSIVRLPCVCRGFAKTPDEGYCLAVTVRPVDDVLEEAFTDFDRGPDTLGLQRLSKDEAMTLLAGAEERGLMHSIWTFITPYVAAICNCDLAGGCLAMRLTLEFDQKIMWRGEGLAAVDPSACTGCAHCVPRCPFSALVMDRLSRKARVSRQACYGCGVCRAACDRGALTLSPRAVQGAAW